MKKFFLLSFILFLAGYIFVFPAFAQIETIPKFTTDYLFNFAVYGDSATYEENPANAQVHRELVTQMEKLNPDFILHTGDIVSRGDSAADWEEFQEITQPLISRPKKLGLSRNFYPTIGNHDLPLDNYFRVFNFDPFSDYENAYYYSFNYKNFHFVSLNTEISFTTGSEQYNWLTKDLQKAKDREIIAFFHRPAYSSGKHGQSLAIQESFVPLFEDYETRAVFSGHDHLYERSFPILGNEAHKEGTVYIVTGGGSAKLYQQETFGNWWTEKIKSISHFIFLQVTRSRIFGWAIDREGNIFDEFEIPNYKFAKNIFTSAGSGGRAHLRKFSTSGKFSGFDFFAFSKDFFGGARIAAGDFNLDGKDEIIAGAGSRGGPQVRIFETDGDLLSQFYAFGKKYKGGLDVAAGDVDGDGKDEIAVSKFSGKSTKVKIFRNNKKKKVLFEKNVFPKLPSGATIALGDIDGDRKAEIISGTTGKTEAQVKIYKYKAEGGRRGRLAGKFKPFEKKYQGGIDVATGDVDGDGYGEIIVSKLDALSKIKVFRYNNRSISRLEEFRAFPKKYKNGVNVEVFDVNSDGKEEIIASQNSRQKSRPQARVFNYRGQAMTKIFLAYNRNFKGGVVAIGVNE
ncbi:MAG: FG-GAP-like repeat-containing protein [Patescibacteria group bacterium]